MQQVILHGLWYNLYNKLSLSKVSKGGKIMANIRRPGKKILTKDEMKKSICTKVSLKSEAEKNTELVLKLMRGYYGIYR